MAMETESSTTVETRGRSSVPIRFDEKDVQDEGSSSFFPPPTAEQKSFKDTIGKMLESKFAERKKAEAKFKLDMCMMITYCVFLAIFTINATRTDNTIIFQARSEVLAALDRFDDVEHVTDIYDYLREVVVPVVAADESLLSHTGNVMLSSVILRQLRVKKVGFNAHPLSGIADEQWPGYTPQNEETRDGGGTVGASDPLSEHPDWPESREWFAHSRCEGGAECFVEDSKALHAGAYPKSGYQSTLNGTRLDMFQSIDDLEAHAFLSRDSTAAVFVEFAAWLTSRRLFCVVTILLENEIGGIHSSVVVRVSPFKITQNTGDRIIGIAVFVYALGVLMVIDFVTMYRRGFGQFWQAGWNYLSFLNYMLFTLSLLLEQQVIALETDLHELAPLSDKAQRFPWHRVANDEQLLQFVTAFNSPLSWLRVLSYLEAISPRTKMLTATIARASSDLSTLFVIFFIVYFGYAMGFYLAFGAQLEEFSTSFMSLTTLFEAILGDFDFDAMYQVHKVLTPLMFTSFFLIVFFLLLNMIMAVVVKTYTETKEMLDHKSHTEVTGVGILKQQLKDIRRLLKKLIRKPRTWKKRGSVISRTGSAGDLDSDNEEEHLSVEDVTFLFENDTAILDRIGVKSWEELMKAADVNGDGKLSIEEIGDFQQSMVESESSRHGKAKHLTKAEKQLQREARLIDLREHFHVLAEESMDFIGPGARSKSFSNRYHSPGSGPPGHRSPSLTGKAAKTVRPPLALERKVVNQWLRSSTRSRRGRRRWSDGENTPEVDRAADASGGVRDEVVVTLLGAVKELSTHVQTLATQVSGLSGTVHHNATHPSTRAVTPRIGLHSRGSVVRLEHAGRRISTPFQPSYDQTIPRLTTHDGGSKVVRYSSEEALDPSRRPSGRSAGVTYNVAPDPDAVVELPGTADASQTEGPPMSAGQTHGKAKNERPETPTTQVINATARMLSAVVKNRRRPAASQAETGRYHAKDGPIPA